MVVEDTPFQSSKGPCPGVRTLMKRCSHLAAPPPEPSHNPPLPWGAVSQGASGGMPLDFGSPP